MRYRERALIYEAIRWEGDKVGYTTLHNWIKRHLVKSDICDSCGQKKPLDLANVSGKYKRDITDWEWLCRKCHMSKDGRLERLIHSRRSNRGPMSHM